MDTGASQHRNTKTRRKFFAPKTGRPGDGLDLTSLFVVGACFAAGLLIAVGLLNTSSGSPQLARQVGDAQPTREAVEPIVRAEVAGVVCEDQVEVLGEGPSAADVVSLWNSTVQSPGDSCIADFDSALGASWVLTDETISNFGDAGSLYEFTSGESGAVAGFSIFLVAQDSDAGQPDSLRQLVNTVWGERNLDWERSCLDTEVPWSAVFGADGTSIELTNCQIA